MTRPLPVTSAALAIPAVLVLAGTLAAHGGVPAGPPTSSPGGWNGPGDTGGTPTGAPGAPAGPAAPGPATGGPSPGGGANPTGPNPATGGHAMAGVATGDPNRPSLSSWEAWWHFNKDPFLDLKRAVHAAVLTSGSSDVVAVSASGPPPPGLVRGTIVPALEKLLDEERANDIVSGALVALARIGETGTPAEEGPEPAAIPRLVGALDDPNQEIAETAALSLGVLRSEAAMPILTRLLEGGKSGGELVGGHQVAARTRAFAAYGLGLVAERAGQNRTRQLAARSLFDALDDQLSTRDVQVAAAIALSLVRLDVERTESTSAPWISRQTALHHLAGVFAEGRRTAVVRAHVATAIARLAAGAPPALRDEALGLFLRALRDPSKLENEVVHSCVQALGVLATSGPSEADRAARAALLRALDESDPQSRAFAMIALGEVGARPSTPTGDDPGDDPAEDKGRGEAECRSALLGELRRGRSTSKPWAAIALGLLERRRAERSLEPSTAVRGALREWMASARGRNEVGSGAVALGLCREARAAKLLRTRLADTNEDTGQGYVALALGMVGDREAVPELREVVLGARYRPMLLEQAAEALALLGDRGNAPEIARLVAEARGLAAQASLANALGWIGDVRAVDPLLGLVAREDLSATTRGLAAAALGRVADESPLPWHASISCGLNYLATTSSLYAGDGTGLLEIL